MSTVKLGAADVDFAACLLDLADDTGSERVDREVLHTAWAAERPGDRRQRHPTGDRAGREQDPRRQPSDGRATRATLLKAITRAERLGWARRDGDSVLVVDRAALERMAAAPDLH